MVKDHINLLVASAHLSEIIVIWISFVKVVYIMNVVLKPGHTRRAVVLLVSIVLAKSILEGNIYLRFPKNVSNVMSVYMYLKKYQLIPFNYLLFIKINKVILNIQGAKGVSHVPIVYFETKQLFEIYFCFFQDS
jgi:hypothetical protein